MREADRQSESEKRGRVAKEAREERIGKEMSKRQEKKEGKEKKELCSNGYTCHLADNGKTPGNK